MKHILFLLPAILIIGACKKNNSSPNTSSICFDTTFLPTNIQEQFESVYFLNGRDGFIAGYKGDIFKTNDSAKSWSPLNVNINLPIYGLYFLNTQIGFAVGGESSCGGTGCTPAGGFILKTIDGGQTWSTVYEPSSKIALVSICFINDSTGFCVGGNIIATTNNGGKSWIEIKMNDLGLSFMQIKFTDNKNGYIASLNDAVLKTSDGGITWQMVSPKQKLGYYAIAATDKAIYAAGQGKIIKSIDKGTSWTALANSPSDIFAIYFTDDENGFAFGRGAFSSGDIALPYGSMYCTNNGGDSWNGTNNIGHIGLIQAVSFPFNTMGYAIIGNEVIRLVLK